MKNLDTSFVCAEIASIAQGYIVLNSLTMSPHLRILDASPAGNRFLIMALGPADEVRTSVQRARDLFEGDVGVALDLEVTDGIVPQVLEALFSLPQIPLEESLVVVECSTVSGLVSVAQQLAGPHALKTIEIKILRSSDGRAFGFFTGSKEACIPAALDAETRMRAGGRHGHVEIIEEPTAGFRSFFNLSGD